MFEDRSPLIAEIPHLRRYAHALARDPDTAEDLVQSCLERAVRNLGQWDRSRRLRPWLFAIMHNLHVDQLRSRSASPEAGLPLADAAEIPWRGASPEETLDTKDVVDAIYRLPADHRDVLVTVALNELSYAEAAEVLGLSAGTLMSRLHRARESLRKSLQMTERHARLRRVK
jgi:RNA polymerase sigma-70 factor, ECF subfamily